MTLATLSQCPFCDPGEGVIAVDTANLAASRIHSREIRDFFTPGRELLVFDPDGEDDCPCPHFVGLCVWCRFERHLLDGSGGEEWNPTIAWLNPRHFYLDRSTASLHTENVDVYRTEENFRNDFFDKLAERAANEESESLRESFQKLLAPVAHLRDEKNWDEFHFEGEVIYVAREDLAELVS